ncbi:MAG: HlyD family secretion protein [Rhodoferax sp.]|nr:HlyD family secretion protein [Rhodoferax sp.]
MASRANVPPPLFRAEALERQQRQWLGTITMVRPLGYAVWTAMACAMGLALMAFFTWGSYTRRVTLTGQLMPSTGLVRVQVPQRGVVLKMRVQEGEAVAAGQPLFDLGSDRQSTLAPAPSGPGPLPSTPGENGGVQATVSARVRERGTSIATQIDHTRALQAEESGALTHRLAMLRAQAGALDNQVSSQRQRTVIAEESEARTAGLVAQGFYAREQLQLKRAESLDQRVKLQGLVREQESITQELQVRADELRALPLRHRALLAELERNRLGVAQELVESESRRELVITAPQAGRVTALSVEAGQAVEPGRTLLSIVPADASLQAHFYAPSRAMGFVRVGDTVRLRYQAYPYQKFGQAAGVVQSVARAALPSSDLAAAGLVPGTASNEPLYRITAGLASQTLNAAGQVWPLQVSMTVEADLMQDNRRLYEWVLEPLYGMAGKL